MAYAPDDSSITVDDLESLRTRRGRALLHEVNDLLARSPDPSVSGIAYLRRTYSASAVHAALIIARLQPKAREKFPDLPDFIWALPEALEQATDSAVARHKASRFAAVTPKHILDLCAGIGGDSRALADIAPVTAIDLSAPRLACLKFSLESLSTRYPIQTRIADVTSIPPSDSMFHIDPARRFSGKRSAEYADLIPSPDFLLHSHPGGAIKLSPAVNFDSLPEGHLEIISHNRSVVQAVLWIGDLARQFPADTQTATMLIDHQVTATYTAQTTGMPISEIAGGGPPPFLYEVDPAFTRARLAHALAHSLHLISLTEDGGYATQLSHTPRVTHPALTAFKVSTFLPYSEKSVVAELRKTAPLAPAGAVEVKTRGKIPGIDTDRLQVLFTKAAPHRQTVLIFRFSGTVCAVIATRLPP